MFGKAIPALIATLALSFPVFAAAPFVPPVFTIGELKPNQTVESVPYNLTTIFLATTPEGDRVPSQPTDVRMAYDDANLYLYFNCWEADMSKLRANPAERDSRIYTEDSMEVFLDTKHDHKTYFHIVVNAAGAIYDEMNKPNTPKSWDGEWSVQTSKEADGWTAIITVPFKSLGISMPSDGTVWGMNFARHETRLLETSCWTDVGSSFHSPERFGEIVFGGAASARAGLERALIASPGKHTCTVQTVSGTAAADYRTRVQVDGNPVARSRSEAGANVEQRETFTVNMRGEGRHTVTVTVTDQKTGNIILRSPILAGIPAHKATLTKYRKVVTALTPKTASASSAYASILRSLEEAEAFARTAMGSNEKWTQLGDRLAALEPALNHAQYAYSDKTGCGYAVGFETPLRKIMRDRFFEGRLGGPAKISTAKNDYEAAQVAVMAYDRDLTGVSVRVSDLKSGNGIIPSGAVTLNLVDYVKTRKPVYPVDYVGWWPDPLMDMKPFDLAKGGIQPVWITVHPSEQTPAGLYKGTVTITPANAPRTTMPIEVRVWDFALPKENHLKTAFTFNEMDLKNWYGELTPEMRRAAYQFLLEHRISPMSLYSSAPVPTKENLEFCVDRGLTGFNLSYIRKETDKARLTDLVNEYRAFLKPKGLWDLAYVYGFDEIKLANYAELIDKFGFVKQQFPDLPTMCTVVPNETLDKYVDIWVPLTKGWRASDAEKYTKRGDSVWWYVCCTPLHPYANYFVDYPAIDPRILSWMNWKYQVPGMLYYTITNWSSNRLLENLPSSRLPHDDPAAVAAIKAGKRWPEVPWNTWTFGQFNGDGHLIYPGPNGNLLSSIRFECIRDGIEDYEMFYILDELVKKNPNADPALLRKAKRLLQVNDSVVKSLTEYTQDPDLLLNHRQEVGDTIERLRKTQ